VSDDDAIEACYQVMGKIDQILETLAPKDVQSFLALLHNDLEERMMEHEEEHPELYE